MVKFVSGADDY